MYRYIAVQSNSDLFEMALFIDGSLIDQLHDDKRQTSKLFLTIMNQLLTENSITLSDLSFVAVNCGPASFSTLRSIIASVNGVHLATGIPLIGIDGLAATFNEFYDATYANTVVLLNAFNNESYYLIAHHNQIVSTGYKKTTLLQDEIQHQFSAGTVNIIDNKICSLETVAHLGYEKFSTQPIPSGYLMPMHLKKHAVELL